jgi:hypothetical protein
VVSVAATQHIILQTPESTLEQPIEPTLQLTQPASQQSSITTNLYFYVLGGIFTGLGALVTIILLVWLARSRGYPIKFLIMGAVGVMSVLVLIFASLIIRISTRNIAPSNPAPTTVFTIVPTSTTTSASSPTVTSTDIVNDDTKPSPMPAPTISQAKISCENNIYFVSLRSTPGTNATNKMLEIPCGETVDLLGPSQKADGLTWWNVSWNGYIGWIADHTKTGKIILIFNR